MRRGIRVSGQTQQVRRFRRNFRYQGKGIEPRFSELFEKRGSTLFTFRNWSSPKVGEVETLFENDAAGYKRVFRETIVPLVTECIEDFGLRKT